MAEQASAPGLFPQFQFLRHVLDSAETDVSLFIELFSDPTAAHFAAAQAVFQSIETITSSLQNQASQASVAQAQVADAQARIAELRETIETLQSTIGTLQIALRHGPQAPPRRKYLRAPEKFTGEEQDIAKRQDQYTAFRSAVNRCLTADYENESEFQKITFLANLLSSSAYTNNQVHFDAITDNPHNPDLWPRGWRTVSDIWSELNKQYQTLDLSRKASMDYDKCKMKKVPFGNFITEFKQLAIKCKKTAEQQVADLKLKVSQELIDASVNRPNKPSAADIDAWTVWWQGIYDDLEEKTHLDNQRKNQGTNFNRDQSKNHDKKHATAAAPPTPDPSSDPMQLDAARQSQRLQTRYTREQCLELGLCTYCKKPGHFKAECKEKQANDAKYNANADTRYNPYASRFPPANQYQSPGPYRNAAAASSYQGPGTYRNATTPSYQSQSSFPPAPRFPATPLRYASPMSPGPMQDVDLGGYVEGSVHSEESGSSIPQSSTLKG